MSARAAPPSVSSKASAKVFRSESTRQRTAIAFLLLGAVTAGAACGNKDGRGAVGVDDARMIAPKANGPDPPVAGFMFASVSERTIGPFFSRHGSGAAAAGLVAWVTVAEGSGRRVLVVPIDAKGAPRGGETVVANVSVDTTTLVVRPMRGSSPGFVIAWTSLTDRGKSLWSVVVDDSGVPRAKPVELTRTNDDIVWIDVIPTDQGALCLWAEETRGGDANLVAAPLNTDGRVRGAPTRVARGIVGWHAIELPNGIGISMVAGADASGKPAPSAGNAGGGATGGRLMQARPGGALSFQRFDADAHPLAPPMVITPKPIVSGDVEVTRDTTSNPARLVFAWTDRTGEEPTVAAATLLLDENAVANTPPNAAQSPKVVVEGPRKIADARGGASLLGLTSGPAGVAVMYEAPTRRKGEIRRVHVSRLALPSLTLGRRPVSLEVVGRGQPELAATASGFAMLATTPDCEQDAPTCANAKAVATVLRLDAQNAIVQREPLTFQADPATLGWGMTCDGEACFTLAASPGPAGSPSRIRTAAVRPRSAGASSGANVAAAKPAAAAASPDAPRISDITAVITGETVVDMATAHFGPKTIFAALSAKGEEAKTTAVTLSTRAVDDNGTPGAPNVISTRALTVGGVAIAGAEKPEDGGAIAWVARENGDPEVHVTRIDKNGRRTNDVQLTTIKGDASDVTITWAEKGWIVAWVDGRDGNGEVYATKVSMDLGRVAREERITNAPGDASDLVALARGDAVWLAWADPRESPRDGIADIYVSAVRMRDAKRSLDEQRLLPTAAHSRTPHFAANASTVWVSWIEEAPIGSETPTASGYGAFFTRLDAAGKPADKPTHIPLAGDGAATSVSIDAGGVGGNAIRAVVARSTIDGISLDAIDMGASPPRVGSLLSLDGPPSLDVALVLDGPLLYFNDEGPQIADRRARRARVAWSSKP